MKILVTGAAGFIGFHTAKRLLERGDEVVGSRQSSTITTISRSSRRGSRFSSSRRRRNGFLGFVRADLADQAAVEGAFAERPFRPGDSSRRAGRRALLASTHPQAYIDSNITGFLNILEGCRHNGDAAPGVRLDLARSMAPTRKHAVLGASAASIIRCRSTPRRSGQRADGAHLQPLFRLPTTGLRFFTVYGPWGRPDMALFLFTKDILGGQADHVFNHGDHTRDFTYVDDIVEGVIRASDQIAEPNPDWSSDDARPGDQPTRHSVSTTSATTRRVELMGYIEAIEASARAERRSGNMLPLQPGDVPDTYADVSDLVKAVGYKPATPVREGVRDVRGVVSQILSRN